MGRLGLTCPELQLKLLASAYLADVNSEHQVRPEMKQCWIICLTHQTGSLGWDIFVQPIIFDINPTLCEESGLPIQPRSDEVIDLTRGQEVVTPSNLTRAVRRLGILILSNPSPGLCKRLLTRVLPQLWAIASLPSSSKKISEEIKTPARTMLQTYFQLFGGLETTLLLIQNLTCRGSLPGAKTAWQFVFRQDTASIELLRQSSDEAVDWGYIESTARQFVELFTNSSSKENVSSIFLQLLQKWIETTKTPNSGTIELTMQDSTSEASISELYEITVLQQLMEQVPEKLVGHFDQLLDLVSQIFVADEQSPLGEDVVGVVLSLLNLVITAPTFQKSAIKPENLSIIDHALTRITQRGQSESAATARNLALLLKYRDELDEDEDKTSMPSAQQAEDRKTYNLAMSYITGGKDNPPPVVSEGLNLLSGLITSQSSILDINAVTVLLSNLLKENEDYINLRVVKMFTLLAAKHPKSTLREIVDNYLDASEKSTTDTRLRFGEALVQVIEKLGELYTGEAAQHTSETLLSIAGRRGHRPKTLGKQERDEKLRKMKQERAQRQGVNDEPEDSDPGFDEEELTEEQKVSNDILAQIVQGWESKRGSEDIRMRASALSIFSSALETNIGGIGATLVSAGVDLCLNILAMEPGMEAGILRRAAIIVILGFVKALNEAKESGRTLGFGLTESSRADIQRTLEYVAATDTDGLVQQHARDVVDSLENWQMVSLLPTTQASSLPGLAGLAGLAVNPIIGGSQAGGTTTRPRIEEIE